ncbi:MULTISPECIES: ABC transporter permease subunit [Pseudomonadaceae]|jgi:branched-chain amino acid transport system permease protein|uniref:ABC transporter permease subunit n=1 Tax=Pseudomonadaceae TaxID=135621 RepID=UPI000E9C292C|nr:MULTISPECIES: branched-chain amino acid ABC transporter permease [Pseudomonadaceae]MBE7375056.1 branched-chain amino acid ABC transporter permease [Pseudomonas lopnurensis]MDH0424952.1 branched-chain amino acid ABC transporter permease [Stutzerimonas stutzeri]HBM62778.1 branched-chain amino acid ABC transporter permease [Pseudomonas sp.]
MAFLSDLFAFLYQAGDAFAFLVLAACGLAVVFGMMGVINMAHGEFILCGAYVCASATRMGLPLPLAILIGALVAGLVGMILERLIIRHLYHRPLDTIVATWGISMIATQGTLIVLGSTLPGTGTPLGSFEMGDYSFSQYRLVLIGMALATLLGLYVLFTRTRFGILARATIQMPEMARAMGINTSLVYSLTFGLGAALAGLAGGLYAPTMTLVPTMGSAFLVEAFVTVVVGGADIFLGTAPAAAVLGVIKAALTSWQGQLMGQIGLLLAAIVVIRVMPRGLSGWLLRERN